MKSLLRPRRTRRNILIALLFALSLTLTLPAIASAHAILLRSDPAKDAVLNGAPQQVRMWFSEDLNPAFSTAAVVNAKNQPVDQKDAHVAPGDSKEMDISLKANLPPSVYIVIYRTDSAEDGHILRGSFIFTVANPDGSLPTLNPNTIPGQNVLSGGNPTGLYTGQLDVPTTFSLIMITLVELGAVFWVGAQLFLIFVLQLAPTNDAKLNTINQEVQRRFEHKWSVPTLLVLLVANFGVLLGQALTISGGQWGAAFAPSLLTGLISNGRFGTFWIVRTIVIAVLLPLALAGVAIMAVTGPFSATIHLSSWVQLFTTAYGRALTVKILLVGALITTSAIHVLLIRPRLKREYYKYAYAIEGVTYNQARQVKLREGRVTTLTRRLMGVLRWEPLLG